MRDYGESLEDYQNRMALEDCFEEGQCDDCPFAYDAWLEWHPEERHTKTIEKKGGKPAIYMVYFYNREHFYHNIKGFSNLVEFSDYLGAHRQEIGGYRIIKLGGLPIEDGKLTGGSWRIITEFTDNKPGDYHE